MPTSRFYSGSRSSGGTNEATKLLKKHMMRGIKLNATERYKIIMKQRMEEHKKKAFGERMMKSGFSLPGTLKQAMNMSARAENALKEMAQKKAAKEEKALRKMVQITPRYFPNGARIDTKGRVFTPQDVQILYVRKKDGRILTTGGMWVGRYRPKSKMNDYTLQTLIDRYTPKPKPVPGQWDPAAGGVGMQMQDMPSVWSNGEVDLQRGGIAANVNAWGIMSENTWGTFSNNAWGTVAENVWGTTNNNVWGGLGGNPYGSGSWRRFWGTNSAGQKNFLKKPFKLLLAALGIGRVRESNRAGSSGRGGGRGGR